MYIVFKLEDSDIWNCGMQVFRANDKSSKLLISVSEDTAAAKSFEFKDKSKNQVDEFIEGKFIGDSWNIKGY